MIHRIVLGFALAFAAGCAQIRDNALPAGTRVLALGDSLTSAWGMAPREAWPALLASRTRWVVINGGVTGDTSAGALRRLPSLLDEHRPTLVLVSVGGNDMLRLVPDSQIVANLDRMLALIQARGARAVLVAMPRPSIVGVLFGNLTPAAFYRQVAAANGVPLVETAFADVLSDMRLKMDPLHPNAAGHALLANRIFDSLEAMGLAR